MTLSQQRRDELRELAATRRAGSEHRAKFSAAVSTEYEAALQSDLEDAIVTVPLLALEEALSDLQAGEEERERLETDTNIAKSYTALYARALEALRVGLLDVCDNVADEGDRVYFGSSNHFDRLNEAVQTMDALRWDEILKHTQPPVDLIAARIAADARTQAAEARSALETPEDKTQDHERGGRGEARPRSASAHEGLEDAAQHPQGGPLNAIRQPVAHLVSWRVATLLVGQRPAHRRGV